MKLSSLLAILTASILATCQPLPAGESIPPPPLEAQTDLLAAPPEENPNTLWAFAFYDIENDVFGYGFRQTFHVRDAIAFHLDAYGEDWTELSDASTRAMMSMEVDLIPGNAWFPYLLTGAGADFQDWQWTYMAGAGIRYELGQSGFFLGAEFVHLRAESDAWGESNQIRLGIGGSWEALGRLVGQGKN